MRSLHADLKPILAIEPQVITSSGGAVSGAVDLQGFDSAEVIVAFGANGGDTLNSTNKFTITLEDSLDDGAGAAAAYGAVDDADIIGATPASGVVATIDDAAEDSQLYRYAYIGGKRFLKVTVTPAGTLSNGNPVSCVVVKGHAETKPTAAH